MAFGSYFGRRRFLPQLLAIVVIVAVFKYLFISILSKTSPKHVVWQKDKHVESFQLTDYQKGKVNIDLWTKTCSLNLNSLRQFPLFPDFPTKREYIIVQDSMKFTIKEQWTSMHIMGYLHPPQTGHYMFYLTSPVMTQFWLSNTASPLNASKLAYTSINVVKKLMFNVGEFKHISEYVYLKSDNKYYFEILLVANDFVGEQGMVLRWMLPSTKYFVKINGNQVSEYFNVSLFYTTPDEQATNEIMPSLQLSDIEDQSVGEVYPLDKTRASESKNLTFSLQEKNIVQKLGLFLDQLNLSLYNRETIIKDLLHLDTLPPYAILKAFETCLYDPGYTKNRVIKRYEGVWSTYFPAIFPNDGSNVARLTMPPVHGYIDFVRGNSLLKESEAVEIVRTLMVKINKAYPRKYLLNSLVNIERYNPKQIKGEKYLVELVLRQQNNNKLYRFSQFFFRKKSTNNKTRHMCLLTNLQWSPKVWVNLILNVKSQSGWILSFVKEMARILNNSHDEYVNFVIADYGNRGIDISKEMKRHGIKHFNVFKKTGPFYKTSSINMAASKVKDPNSIILLMDLHLRYPDNIFEMIRKHTIKGKSGFSPMLMRLCFCGRPKTKHVFPHGFYEPNGFGIFATYKSDWDAFGGMNEKDYKNKWGGEDWEMVDRFLMKGYEIEKIRLPGFYHYFHDKTGMWNS